MSQSLVTKQCTHCDSDFEVYPYREKTALYCSRSCLAKVKNTKHGGSKTRTYNVWRSMKNRCDCLNNTHYAHYGGRGISYDPRWSSYQSFVEDMGMAPDNRELDRIDNDGNYTKENCRWTTRKKQNENRRVRSDSVTGVKGVSPHQKGFVVRIKHNYKSIYVGTSKDLKKAKKMRLEAENKYWK